MEYKIPSWFEAQATPERVAKLRKEAFTDPYMHKWTFENDDRSNEKVSELARKYVENFSDMEYYGKGLILCGDVGVGKSYIAACIANALIDKGTSVKYTEISRVANEYLACDYKDKQAYLDAFKDYDLLIVDDLGTERGTEFVGEISFGIINARVVANKPLIVTTNATKKELWNPTDPVRKKVFSRLFEICFPVEVEGVDRRKTKAKEHDAELKKMLGL